jgi:exosortase A
MTTSALPAADIPIARGPVRTMALALGIGLVAIGLLFHAEIAAALGVWETSTAYGHCVFVLPIALYLAWDRRTAIRGTMIVPLPLAALLAFPLALGWLAAERVGLMEGRQLVAISLVQVLFLAVLGWRMWRALAVPLLYLFFLVPFGAFVTPALQGFTARFIVVGLNILGISNYADNYVIEIPEGTFYVAEACAGLRFLIAAIAFGVLYACLIYRSPVRRAAFIATSIVVPIIANGFRGLGIVVLGHVLGSAEAAAADHIIYGWLFFSVVILVLIAAGLPFRQDGGPYAPVRGRRDADLSGRPAMPGQMALAAALAIVLTASGPASAALIERAASGGGIVAVDPRFVVPPGCAAVSPEAEPDAPPGAVRHRFRCDQTALTLTVATLPGRANPAAVIGAIRRMSGELEAEDAEFRTLRVAGGTPAGWRLVETSTPALMTAVSLWIEGAPAASGLGFRLGQAWRSVAGAGHDAVVIAAGIDPGVEHLSASGREASEAVLARFLGAQTDLADQVSRLSLVAVAR